LQLLRERHSDLVRARAQNLAKFDECRPQLLDRQADPRLPAQMGERLAVAILANSLHHRDIVPAAPILQSVFAEDRQNLAPAIDIAIDIRNRADLHTANRLSARPTTVRLLQLSMTSTRSSIARRRESPQIQLQSPLQGGGHRVAVRYHNQDR